jgi:hypothetical protein
MYLRKTKLESEIEKLKREIKELREQKEKLIEELRSIYEFRYPTGKTIHYTGSFYDTRYGTELKELQFVKIVFIETKGESYYTYYYDTEVGAVNGIYLNREDAEKARELYLKEKEEKTSRES